MDGWFVSLHIIRRKVTVYFCLGVCCRAIVTFTSVPAEVDFVCTFYFRDEAQK